jgi:hypothetical protein
MGKGLCQRGVISCQQSPCVLFQGMLGWLVNCQLADFLKSQGLTLINGEMRANTNFILNTEIISIGNLIRE